MKYFYLSKKDAKNGEACVFGIYDEELTNPSKIFAEEACIFIGKELPHFITYDTKTGKVRAATEAEQVARGQMELRDDQVVLNGKVLNIDKRLQKIEGDKIVDKTRSDLIEDKVITLASEKEKARSYRVSLFEALDMLDIKVVRGRMDLTEDEEKEIEEWRKVWLDIPEKYLDLESPIEDLYPVTPVKVAYYL